MRDHVVKQFTRQLFRGAKVLEKQTFLIKIRIRALAHRLSLFFKREHGLFLN